LDIENDTTQVTKDAEEAKKQAAKDAKTYADGEAAMLKILNKKADAEKKIDDLIKSRVSKMQDQAALMISEGALRKSGADETYIQNELEKKKLELYIKQEKLNDDQAASLRLALEALQDQEKALKRINIEEQARLSLQSLQIKAIEESPSGQALRKYGARGTKSTKDPTFGTGPNAGKSIYDTDKSNKTIKETIDLTRELTEAQKQQVDIADSVSGAFGGFFMDLVDGTTSAKDAFRSMATDIIQQLYRILIVEQLVNSIAGAITGSFAPASAAGTGGSVAPPRRPTGVFNRYEGGGYTGSGPRSGGLDGKGGFMAMLHPRETVVDHTKGQGAGGTTVNQVFNISANTSDDTKRLITQTIAQASPAIINQSGGAVMNQRRRGGSMKSAFG
jgi:hypothetical protein